MVERRTASSRGRRTRRGEFEIYIYIYFTYTNIILVFSFWFKIFTIIILICLYPPLTSKSQQPPTEARSGCSIQEDMHIQRERHTYTERETHTDTHTGSKNVKIKLGPENQKKELYFSIRVTKS